MHVASIFRLSSLLLLALRARRASTAEERLRREGAVWGLCLFCALLLLVGPLASSRDEAPPSPLCPLPREARAERGWTRAVTCAPRSGGGRALRGPARWLFGRRIDLNAADARLLESLPGIGAARARDILAERRRRPFATLDELARTRGIGRRTVERLRPFVRVDPPRRAATAIEGGEG